MINRDVDFRNQLGGNVAYIYELGVSSGQCGGNEKLKELKYTL